MIKLAVGVNIKSQKRNPLKGIPTVADCKRLHKQTNVTERKSSNIQQIFNVREQVALVLFTAFICIASGQKKI